MITAVCHQLQSGYYEDSGLTLSKNDSLFLRRTNNPHRHKLSYIGWHTLNFATIRAEVCTWILILQREWWGVQEAQSWAGWGRKFEVGDERTWVWCHILRLPLTDHPSQVNALISCCTRGGPGFDDTFTGSRVAWPCTCIRPRLSVVSSGFLSTRLPHYVFLRRRSSSVGNFISSKPQFPVYYLRSNTEFHEKKRKRFLHFNLS